jgi:hypothetical protein
VAEGTSRSRRWDIGPGHGVVGTTYVQSRTAIRSSKAHRHYTLRSTFFSHKVEARIPYVETVKPVRIYCPFIQIFQANQMTTLEWNSCIHEGTTSPGAYKQKGKKSRGMMEQRGDKCSVIV